jgi:transcription-repair coupling factor (superfamily II helicase)
VLEDLEAGRPMDRLVVGDVGFGKTEVAMRAAFVAAAQGLQVAVIAPTTLLARQHAKTFADRFRGFPVNVRQLSRFVGPRRPPRPRRAWPMARSISSSAPMRCWPRASGSTTLA